MPRRTPTRFTTPDTVGITKARAAIGLSAPSLREKLGVWSQLSVPSAAIYSAEGGYQPSRLMLAAHGHEARAICVCGGVRVGKSLGLAMEVVPWTVHSELIWIAGNSYDLARQEIDYIAEALISLGWTTPDLVSLPKIRYQPCVIETLWGCRIETRSLHDVNTFVSRAPDFVGLCEPGQAPPESLAKSRERVSTRRGRVWLAGTFEDVTFSWLEDKWRSWVRWPNAEGGKSFSVPTWTNQVTFPGGKNDPEILAMKNSYATFEEFLLRCAGVPMPGQALVVGSYWNAKNNVQDISFIPTSREGFIHPVELAIDPGYGSKYVVEAIQEHDNKTYVIDEVAVNSLVHEEVIDACKRRPWWRNVTGGVIDPYAGQSHVYGAVSPQEVWWQRAKIALRPAPRYSVEDSVTRLCHELRDPTNGKPNLVVSPNAERFIWEMSHWRKRKTRDGWGKPSENNCDASKAVAYWLAERYNRIQTGGVVVPIVRPYTWS